MADAAALVAAAEEADKVQRRQQACEARVAEGLDWLIASVAALRDQLASATGGHQGQQQQQQQLKRLEAEVEQAFKECNGATKELHSAVGKLGKVCERVGGALVASGQSRSGKTVHKRSSRRAARHRGHRGSCGVSSRRAGRGLRGVLARRSGAPLCGHVSGEAARNGTRCQAPGVRRRPAAWHLWQADGPGATPGPERSLVGVSAQALPAWASEDKAVADLGRVMRDVQWSSTTLHTVSALVLRLGGQHAWAAHRATMTAHRCRRRDSARGPPWVCLRR